MSKLNKAFLATTLLISAATAVTACSGAASGIQPEDRVVSAVNEAMTLSREDLFKKAAEEIGGKRIKVCRNIIKIQKSYQCIQN